MHKHWISCPSGDNALEWRHASLTTSKPSRKSTVYSSTCSSYQQRKNPTCTLLTLCFGKQSIWVTGGLHLPTPIMPKCFKGGITDYRQHQWLMLNCFMVTLSDCTKRYGNPQTHFNSIAKSHFNRNSSMYELHMHGAFPIWGDPF